MVEEAVVVITLQVMAPCTQGISDQNEVDMAVEAVEAPEAVMVEEMTVMGSPMETMTVVATRPRDFIRSRTLISSKS